MKAYVESDFQSNQGPNHRAGVQILVRLGEEGGAEADTAKVLLLERSSWLTISQE
jgi:hypothetical protein